MKNINEYLGLLPENKKRIMTLQKEQQTIFNETCEELEIHPDSTMGLCLFDYLFNGSSLHQLQKSYRTISRD
jgi:hypothetical protein